MCDNNNVRLRLCLLPVLLGSCGDHDAILNQIHQHNNGYTEGGDVEDTTGGGPAQTSAPVETTDSSATTADETGETTAAGDQVELHLSASVESLTQAGSVLLTLETGDTTIESLDLFVANADGPVQKIAWPVGQPSVEYIVDHPNDNGTIEFRVLAQTGGEPVSAVVSVDVQLPASGSVKYTWQGDAGTQGKAVVVEPGQPGFHDRVLMVGNTGGEITLSEFFPLGGVVEQPLVESYPLDITSATMLPDRSLVLVGSVGDDAEVRLYRRLNGRWVRYWVRSFADTVLHDSAAVGEDVLVVGEAHREDGIDATAWQLTESGGTVFSDTLSLVNAEDESLDSSIRSVSVREQQVVGAGFVLSEIYEDHPKQPRLFTFAGGVLSAVPRPLTDESVYVAGSFSPAGKFIAWGRTIDDTSFRSTHNSDLSLYKTVAVEGEIVAAARGYAVGSWDGRPGVFRNEWLFQSPELGTLTALGEDRFGNFIGAGHTEVDGKVHSFVVALHP